MGVVALVDVEFLRFALPLLVKDSTEECRVFDDAAHWEKCAGVTGGKEVFENCTKRDSSARLFSLGCLA